jgi:NADH:ubiquinone reductase (H+-translocating)
VQHILVLGGGFAGLWSALGAARALDGFGVGSDRVEVTLIDRRSAHSIRVRNYEADLGPTLVPLAGVLEPAGVRHIMADVTHIDTTRRCVAYATDADARTTTHDRLVFALGSRLTRPPIPGLDKAAFDIDSYEAAARLGAHIGALPSRPVSPGRATALVVGGGLTGIEAACELPARLRTTFAGQAAAIAPRVIIADHKPWIGSDMGDGARAVIATALSELAIESRPGVTVASVDAAGVVLGSGERIAAETVIWCGGMQAHPLTTCFSATRDRFGRLPVDRWLKIDGLTAEFAAGDAAWLPIDGVHPSVMSCQHARPMGRYAGHNAACDLLGQPMLPLDVAWYVTVLDLGPWGAVYTEGWDRQVVAQGAAAKRTKETINRERIYPPRSGNRRDLLDAAAPKIQTPRQRTR